jgi:hypothetical protein
MRKPMLIATVLLTTTVLAAHRQPPTPFDRARELPLHANQFDDALTLPVAAPPSHVIPVPAGAKLQAAIDSAQTGDTIALTPGTTYTGAIVLRNKEGAGTITITTAGEIPPGRMTIAGAAMLAKIVSGTAAAAITTAASAHNYALVGLEVGTGPGRYPVGLVRIGSGDATQTSLDQVPAHVLIDRCYIHGDPATGAKRGIDANGADLTVTRSYISDIKGVGQDTQAIAGINGPGPFVITDNYLEAAGENIIFGGGDPKIPNLIPSDITIRGNTITKPIAWRAEKWSIKNLIELKNAQRVLIERNVIEHVWLNGQTGFVMLFTVRNQNGTCPWCTVAHVEVRSNVLRHASQGIQILGLDDQKNAATGLINPSVRLTGLTIHDNLVYDIDPTVWGGDRSTRMLAVNNGPMNVSVTHNTFLGTVGGALSLALGRSKTPAAALTITCNVWPEGKYGIKADGVASGAASWSAITDAASVFSDNAIQPGASKINYPGRNRRAPMTFDASFMPTPPYICADRSHAGVDVAALLAAIPGLDLAK